MNGVEVGTWSISPSAGDALQYVEAWTRSGQGRPISLSLPFTPGNAPHRGAKVAAYFENLLPDGRSIRERVARRFHTGSVEPFDLLAEVGRDCVGALQILPRGDAPQSVTTLESEPLTDAQVAQVLRGAVTSAPLGLGHDEDDLRISIAGAQEKTALLRVDGQWCMPRGTTPTTHILKLPLGLAGGMRLDLSESVENEWLCSLILKAYGLPVATCERVQFDDMKALAVERFDRTWWRGDTGDARIVRLPQEDMCQVKGLPPQAKYEADGGPGIDGILESLEGSMTRDADRRTFFQAQVICFAHPMATRRTSACSCARAAATSSRLFTTCCPRIRCWGTDQASCPPSRSSWRWRSARRMRTGGCATSCAGTGWRLANVTASSLWMAAARKSSSTTWSHARQAS